MKLSNLIGEPIEVKQYDLFTIEGIEFFWCQYAGRQRMSEVKTGLLVTEGSFARCRATVKRKIKEIKARLKGRPTLDEVKRARIETMQLQQQYRRATGNKLANTLNKKSIVGNLYVENLPRTTNIELFRILNKIKKIQEKEI